MSDQTNKPWIVVDCNNLAWRAFYTTGHLSHNGVPTGVAYGFLRDLLGLENRFDSHQFVFCFDSDRSVRKKVLPEYKYRRDLKGTSDPMLAIRKHDVAAQIDRLMKDYLPALGFRNIFRQDGYEADDLIASAVMNTNLEDSNVIITGDRDVYQLISPRIVVYHPQSRTTIDMASFAIQWGLHPIQWVNVKAIAGCKTDDIPGVDNVGEITAAKYLSGRLCNGKKMTACDVFVTTSSYDRNLSLVRLPLPGTVKVKPQEQPPVSKADWDSLTARLGVKSLPLPERRNLYSEV